MFLCPAALSHIPFIQMQKRKGGREIKGFLILVCVFQQVNATYSQLADYICSGVKGGAINANTFV